MVAAVLGACSGEGGEGAPSPTATTTASATVTPSPTPTPAPSRPAAMARGDVEGAEAAARYFLSLYPYAYSTGDLEEWIALSDPECVFCASVVDDVRELRSRDAFQTGGEIGWISVDASQDGDLRFRVDVTATESPAYEIEGGEATIVSSGGQSELAFLLEWDGSWTVLGVAVEAAK